MMLSESFAAKKRRQETSVKPHSTEELCVATARLALSSASALRQLKAITVRTLILKTASPFATADRAATKKWTDDKTLTKDPPYIKVFEALVRTLVQQSETPTSLIQDYNKLVHTSLFQDLLKHVKVCRISKCYQAEFCRLELSTDTVLDAWVEALVTVIIQQGGRECLGSAPRQPLERQVATELALLR